MITPGKCSMSLSLSNGVHCVRANELFVCTDRALCLSWERGLGIKPFGLECSHEITGSHLQFLSRFPWVIQCCIWVLLGNLHHDTAINEGVRKCTKYGRTLSSTHCAAVGKLSNSRNDLGTGLL